MTLYIFCITYRWGRLCKSRRYGWHRRRHGNGWHRNRICLGNEPLIGCYKRNQQRNRDTVRLSSKYRHRERDLQRRCKRRWPWGRSWCLWVNTQFYQEESGRTPATKAPQRKLPLRVEMNLLRTLNFDVVALYASSFGLSCCVWWKWREVVAVNILLSLKLYMPMARFHRKIAPCIPG